MATTQPTTDNAAPTATGTGTGGGNDPATTADGNNAAITDLPDLSTAASVGQPSTVSVTDAPSLSETATSIFHLSDVPTIAGYGIPTQVVPWTAGAPYMQTSKLPEGTVFIIVGAVLGFLGMAVLAWRGMVAWSLHRSVKRAALGTHYNDSMLKMSSKPPLSSSAAMGSTLSLDRLSAPAGKLSRTHARTNSGTHGMPNANAARNSSLFFSPTAGAGAHHTSHSASANRSSAYLPAGYYASPSAAAPASSNKHASIGGGGSLAPATGGAASRLSSLNPNHPSNRGYTQQSNNSEYNISPPDSPGSMAPTNRPSTGGTLGNSARSTRGGYERVSGVHERRGEEWGNLNVPGGAPPGQRAPSANLEDLFEHHGNGMRGY